MKIKWKDRNGDQLKIGDKIKIYSRRNKDKFVIREIIKKENSVGIKDYQGNFTRSSLYPSNIVEKIKE